MNDTAIRNSGSQPPEIPSSPASTPAEAPTQAPPSPEPPPPETPPREDPTPAPVTPNAHKDLPEGKYGTAETVEKPPR